MCINAQAHKHPILCCLFFSILLRFALQGGAFTTATTLFTASNDLLDLHAIDETPGGFGPGESRCMEGREEGTGAWVDGWQGEIESRERRWKMKCDGTGKMMDNGYG